MNAGTHMCIWLCFSWLCPCSLSINIRITVKYAAPPKKAHQILNLAVVFFLSIPLRISLCYKKCNIQKCNKKKRQTTVVFNVHYSYNTWCIYPWVNRIYDFDINFFFDYNTIWDMLSIHLYNPIRSVRIVLDSLI